MCADHPLGSLSGRGQVGPRVTCAGELQPDSGISGIRRSDTSQARAGRRACGPNPGAAVAGSPRPAEIAAHLASGMTTGIEAALVTVKDGLTAFADSHADQWLVPMRRIDLPPHNTRWDPRHVHPPRHPLQFVRARSLMSSPPRRPSGTPPTLLACYALRGPTECSRWPSTGLGGTNPGAGA